MRELGVGAPQTNKPQRDENKRDTENKEGGGDIFSRIAGSCPHHPPNVGSLGDVDRFSHRLGDLYCFIQRATKQPWLA
jgi:hypothetical protein